MADEVVKSNEGVSRKSQQDQVKQLKRNLEGWREILLPLNSVLMWEKPFFPGVLAGVVTFIFLLLWYCEPSVLTTVSLLGIIACVLDYGVPLASASFFDSNKWTGTQEGQFEDICKGIVQTYKYLQDLWDSLTHLKETKPKVYFITVLAFLIMVAWIGNMVDNLFLTYLLVLVLVLLPGLKHHGLLQQYVGKAVLAVKNIIGQKQKKN